MNVFISADLEGISGVATMDDVIPGKPGYPAACKAMTGDVNAAVEGAVAAGADEIVVFDAHAGGTNLDLETLHPAAEVIRGQPMPVMVGGVEEGVDALFLVGYHAMRGTAAGVMDHTYSSRYHCVRINGREYGELGLAAAYAGSFGVPVALVTGDERLAAEAGDFVPQAAAAVVKRGIGRHSARCLPLAKARERIREAAGQAMAQLDTMTPLIVEAPLALEVEFPSTIHADRAACIPTVDRVGDRTVACTLGSVPDLVRLLSVLVCIRE